MLTSKNFKDIRLGRVTFGGYKARDVNKLIGDLKTSILKLEEENSELLCKVKDLLQKNNKYKDEQESIRTTLIKAQKLADSSIKEARSKSEEIISKANLDAEIILKDAKLKAEDSLKDYEKDINLQKETLANLKKAVKDFRSNILNLYKDHIKIVNSFTMDERLMEKTLADKEKDLKSDLNINKEDSEKKYIEIKDTDKKVEIKNDNTNKTVNKKFINLKFGEDYDVSKDTEESSVGLFSKIQ